MDDSVRLDTVPMTSTALNGNLPNAVSPDSITASAPSRTAIAMSDTWSRPDRSRPVAEETQGNGKVLQVVCESNHIFHHV
jgi:hypothetical protein